MYTCGMIFFLCYYVQRRDIENTQVEGKINGFFLRQHKPQMAEQQRP